MTKKYVLASTLSAFLAAANIAQAPVLDIHKSSPIETREIRNSNLIEEILSDDIKEGIKKEEESMNLALKVIEIAEKDKIYRYILDAYRNIEIPEYISKKFIRAQIWAESWDTENAVGKAGERGLMQIMPGTWKKLEPKLSFQKAFNPQYNIPAGVKHLISLDTQLEKRNKNWEKLSNEEKIKLLAATYNCGLGGIIKAKYNLKRVPETTKVYVRNIEKLMSKKYKEY